MSDSAHAHPLRAKPTTQRPLLGLTILLVEDSRFASEAMRQMCLASGARLRRADSLVAARRHLAAYCPSLAIVDLGLPDGDGQDLIAEMAADTTRRVPVLATSGDDGAAGRAHAAGAEGFLTKPVAGLGAFQAAVLALLPPEARPRGPRPVTGNTATPDPLTLREDLGHARDMLRDSADAESRRYAVDFLGGVARCAQDDDLAALATAARDAVDGAAALDRLDAALATRLESPQPI